MTAKTQTSLRDDHPLAYRLSRQARFQPLADGKAAIVLRFPLRVILVHSDWQPVLACLKHRDWVALDQIAQTVCAIPAATIELFLNGLIRKELVEQKGYCALDDADYPPVSVIIPVRNRPQEISACLDSLRGLDYPADKLEIIVVDDASEDGTPQIVARYPEVRLLRRAKRRQASFCRNRAAEIARGEILAFIDSDCLAAPTWLKELVPAFRDPSLGALGGLVDAASQENGLDRYEKVKSALKIGTGFRRSEQTDRFFYVPTCNCLVRRDAFLNLGGFQETLYVGEDVDFCWRLQDAGYTLEYRPMGRVAHKHRNRLTPFFARRFDYGTSEPMLQQLHASRVKTLYLPWSESLFWLTVVLALALKTPLPLALGIGGLVWAGLKKHATLKSRKIPVGVGAIGLAILRGNIRFVFHCCGFISRYYLVLLPVIWPLSTIAAATILAMHLTAGIVQFVVNKPKLNPISFLFYFTLEQVAYQSGVWWGCIQRFNFKPVLPRIIHKLV
jgi:mycofactocin glycosyltransferase